MVLYSLIPCTCVSTWVIADYGSGASGSFGEHSVTYGCFDSTKDGYGRCRSGHYERA